MTWLGSENSILHYNIPYWQRDIFSEWSCDPFSSLKNALWSDLKNTREGASKVLVNLVFSFHFCYSVHCSHYTIVNRGDWLGTQKPSKHQRNKQRCQVVCWRSATLRNLLFSLHTLYINYVTNTFLLVSSSVQSKQLLWFVRGQGQKTEQ